MQKDSWTEKPATKWLLQDLQANVGTDEGLYLEFKKPSEFLGKGQFSSERFSEELAETTSAFLNSDGGVLLLGVQTERVATDKRVERLKPIAEWNPDQSFETFGINLSASQILERINNNLSPRPLGIQVHRIDVPITTATTAVFVVSVPPSPLGAHQSLKSQRYYKRVADGDVPMLDYEIRAINSRRTGPILHLNLYVSDAFAAVLKLQDEGRVSEAQFREDGAIWIVLTTQNLGKGVARIARFDLGLPAGVTLDFKPAGWQQDHNLQTFLGTTVSIAGRAGRLAGISRIPGTRGPFIKEQNVQWWTGTYNGDVLPYHPLWATPELVTDIAKISLKLPTPFDSAWLPWRVLAEDMAQIRGVALLQRHSNLVYLQMFDTDTVGWAGYAEDQGFEDLKARFQIK